MFKMKFEKFWICFVDKFVELICITLIYKDLLKVMNWD